MRLRFAWDEPSPLAERELSSGFPLLHERVIVSLWTILEATIKTFLARWLQHYPGAMNAETVRQVKVPIADFDAMDNEERTYWIVPKVTRLLGSNS